MCWSPAATPARPPSRPPRSGRRRQGAACRGRRLRQLAGRGCRAAGGEARANYGHLVMAADTRSARTSMPRVAALLDVAQVSEAIQVVSPDTFVRPIYAGNAMATVQTDRQDQGRHRAPDQLQGRRRRRLGAGRADRRRRRGRASRPMSAPRSPSRSGPSSPAPRSSSRAAAAWPRARTSRCSRRWPTSSAPVVGASRAAVDAGYVPNDYQVGQTGKVVAPDLYIAIGISGAIQHLAGMKDSKTIVAINKDEEAPIFQVADYGIVGDPVPDRARADGGCRKEVSSARGRSCIARPFRFRGYGRMIQRIGVIGAGQMGGGIAHVCALKGLDRLSCSTSTSWRSKRRIDAFERQHGPADRPRPDQAGREGCRAAAHPDRHRLQAMLADCDLVDRGGDRERGRSSARSSRRSARSCRRRAAGDQHLVDLGDAPGVDHRPARQVHGHAFHEPGADDAPGRADPRHRHGRGDVPRHPRPDDPPRQEAGQRRGLPGLHRQPHPAADDQRGGLCALRGRRHRRGDRHRR